MKAAIVSESGKTPAYGDFPEPVSASGECLVTVSSAALSQLTKGRASGQHYSSSGTFPFVAGVDGAGRLADGRRVYFVLPRAPFGGMAEQTVAPCTHCVPVPDDLDDITAAAIANPAMSSWAALRERAHLVAGETVLINGATGTSGRLAVQIAKHMGAKKVIATGRNAETLSALRAIGADDTIPLGSIGDEFENAMQSRFREGVEIVLDYLWGQSAERILVAAAKAAPEAVPIRYVNIGTMSSPNITLPGAALRSSAIQLMGSGIGSIPQSRLIGCIADLLQAAVPAGLAITTQTYPLHDVEAVWNSGGDSARIVFQIP